MNEALMRLIGEPARLPHDAQEIRSTSSTSALLRIFRDNEPRLLAFLTLRLGSHAEAQDAAQTVFLRAWERVLELRPDNIPALIFVIARNLSTDIIRSRTRRHDSIQTTEEHIGTVKDNRPGADRLVAARQDLQLIAGFLQELPEKCRTAFVFYKFEEVSYKEIAAIMGVTESMVRKYVLRATAHCVTRFAQVEGRD